MEVIAFFIGFDKKNHVPFLLLLIGLWGAVSVPMKLNHVKCINYPIDEILITVCMYVPMWDNNVEKEWKDNHHSPFWKWTFLEC
jgi:hypothetical protein